MKVLFNLLKLWITFFVLFILISFIMPNKRPFAEGEIYVNTPVYSYPVITEKPHLIIKDLVNSKDILKKVKHWKEHNRQSSIVFIIPRYEAILYYFYLKKQTTISAQEYKISAVNEVFDLKKIFFKYHETMGILVEYVIDLLIEQKNKIVNKFHK